MWNLLCLEPFVWESTNNLEFVFLFYFLVLSLLMEWMWIGQAGASMTRRSWTTCTHWTRVTTRASGDQRTVGTSKNVHSKKTGSAVRCSHDGRRRIKSFPASAGGRDNGTFLLILSRFDVFITPNECDISVLYRHSALFLYIFVHNIYI